MSNVALDTLATDPSLTKDRHTISAGSFADEETTMQTLLAEVEPIETLDREITRVARGLVDNMRAGGGGTGVEAFLHQYDLKSEEGVAIMCLAEALLRIPDKATADALIRDTFEDTKWKDHIGSSDSLFVNASSWGLMMTGKVVNLGGKSPFGVIGKAVSRMGEPTIRTSLKMAMSVIGKQFVLGEGIDDALKEAAKYKKNHYNTSFDILGEGARTDRQAKAYTEAYLHAIDQIGEKSKGFEPDTYNLSVKLSALHPHLHLTKLEQLKEELLPRMVAIAERAKNAGIRVTIDAEEAARFDVTLELFTLLLDHEAVKDYDGIGYVVQAYQKRATHVIDYLAELAKRTNRIIPLRLVKGAYWDSEIKWAQEEGLAGYPVFTRKEHTDVSYLACAAKLLQQTKQFYPQFATHNARTAASIIVLAKKLKLKSGAYEFQRLHGMGEKLHNQFIGDIPCRIYGPVGQHRDLLAYLIRRLMENGANTSFVNLLMDQKTPVEDLLYNPIIKTRELEGTANNFIPLPKHLYGGRWQNSSGVDASYRADHDQLKKQVADFDDTYWKAAPIVACPMPKGLESRKIFEPAKTDQAVGEVVEASSALVGQAIEAANDAFETWSKRLVDERAMILENMADLIEKHYVELFALCTREAGKTWHDTMAEIREAADFCRFYAHQARQLMVSDKRPSPTGESNRLDLHPRGVIGCISPWNFPLAIFMGQIAAGLVTGNCVIAKPAGQTPLIAHRACELFMEAGLPKGVLQLVPGGGRTVGTAIVSNPSIKGIVFTGSVATAKHIQRTLIDGDRPIVPLIAETGGLNCMVVDSSALLEQACDDIVLSAFGSAGQRCSALRMLYVQDDIADELLEMIAGAMQELHVAHPKHFHTDIGPVIDSGAKQLLDDHIADLNLSAKLIAHAPIADDVLNGGHFVTPHTFELKKDTDLKEEFFGPILHVVRFKHSELAGMPKRINSFGYGLTFGIHSRIQDHIEYFIERMHVGNMYVNRSMTGAVVGVQPFGGEGLSGTGPKAGGKLYLTRFLTERHVTINTAAIGGDLQLLSQS